MQVQPNTTTRVDGQPSETPIRTRTVFDPAPSAQSTLGLVGQLIDELSALFRHEVVHTRAEMKVLIQMAAGGLVQVGIGGLVLLVALLPMVAAGVLALALV